MKVSGVTSCSPSDVASELKVDSNLWFMSINGGNTIQINLYGQRAVKQ